MPLQAWSPTIQLAKLDRNFEDVLDHFMNQDWSVGKLSPRSHDPPSIESFIDSGRLVVRADLPGVDPKDVEIRVEGNVLTIRGSRVASSEEQCRNFIHQEIRYGSFERAISIPSGVKEEDISAAYRNGVLELTVARQSGRGQEGSGSDAEPPVEPERHQ